MQEVSFYSEARGVLTLSDVITDVVAFVKKDPSRFYKIMIGSDSAAVSPVSVVTAVTVWRVGNGAIYFWMKSGEERFHTLQDRIWREAIASITLGQEMRSRLGQALGDAFFWDGNEIHVDIGEHGPTKELIESVTGMIKGYNFTPVIKPYAVAASSVADRHT